MTTLWGRVWSVQVGTLLIESLSPASTDPVLNISFKVRKSQRPEPNEAEISIFNLNKAHRNYITGLEDGASVILRAGYEELGMESIFQGDLRASPAKWDGPTVETKLEGSDGGTSYRNARIQRSFPADTPVSTVLTAAVDALGVGRGNLPQYENSLELTNAGRVYPDATVLSGPARDEVNRIVAGCGASWSIQNGTFQIRTEAPNSRGALRLTPETGLIGSPTKSRDQGEVIVNAEALLIPGAYPGRVVVLESREVGGQFEIYRVEYVGETRGNDWKVALELKEY